MKDCVLLQNKQKQIILLNILQSLCVVTLQHSEVKEKLQAAR